MSRSARRLAKSREANRRRFFATVEQLERRDLLIWAPVSGGYSGDQYVPPKACDWLCPIISTVQGVYQAVMDFVGHFDGQSGDNSVAPRAAGASSGEGFLPNYSTRSQRGVLASGNITIPNGTTYTSLKMETTFNSSTSASRYFDPSGLAALDVFQVGEWLDVSGLSPGRYPYHMDFTAYYSGGSETFDYDGYVLVGGAEDELISDGWTIGGVDRLTVSTNGALWEAGDGSMYWFADAGSTYTRSGGELTYSTLTENVNGTFTLSDRWGGSMLFSSAGLLTTKTDRDGNETNFAYIDADSDSQTDDLSEIELFDGTTMDFTYTSGQLTSITDFDGRSVALAYNGSNQLASMTFGDPDSSGPLAALVVGFTYESITGYLATVTVGSYVTEYTYGFTGALVSRENPDGTVENFSAAWPQALPQPGYGTSGSPAPAVNVNDIIITKENADGETTSWVLGTYGRIKKMIDALGNVTTFTLDAAGRVTKRTDPDPDGAGSLSAPETDYGYDSKHNLTSMQLPDGTDLTWTYDSTWNVPTQSTDELGLVTIYTVNSTTGRVDSIRQVIGENDLTNSETDDIVTEFTYYALGSPGTDPPAGLVETMTDGLGRDTLYDYNCPSRLNAGRLAA